MYLPTVIPCVKLQSSKREPTAIAFNTNTSFIYMIVYDVQIFSRSMRIYSTYLYYYAYSKNCQRYLNLNVYRSESNFIFLKTWNSFDVRRSKMNNGTDALL